MVVWRGRGISRHRSPPAQRTLSKTPRSPKSPTGNEPITIFLRDSNSGEETYFSLRYRSTLRIVFTVFAERKGLSQENLKFSFNSQVLTGYETPYSLGLEDRARIDVQVGPRRSSPPVSSPPVSSPPVSSSPSVNSPPVSNPPVSMRRYVAVGGAARVAVGVGIVGASSLPASSPQISSLPVSSSKGGCRCWSSVLWLSELLEGVPLCYGCRCW